MKKDYIYDIETFPNVFTFAKVAVDNSEKFVFEISDRRNDIDHFLDFCRKSMLNGDRWIGYNNLGFDYPVVHWILEKAIKAKKDGKKLRITANQIYKYAMKVIDSNKDGFGKNGTLVATIKGTKSSSIIEVLQKTPLKKELLFKKLH